MKLPRRNFLHLAAGAAALPAVSRIGWALDYPTRPVRVIVPFAPAGTTDILARLIGQWLSERLGQQFVIENRPGASTIIGTEAVARASADGYTLLLATPSSPHCNFSFSTIQISQQCNRITTYRRVSCPSASTICGFITAQFRAVGGRT
jgi:tripartite-type tricarboxylate transporter receptor subunit TctC